MKLRVRGKAFYKLLPCFQTKTLLMMKLTAILLLAAIMQVSAKGFSQKISFHGKNISLKKLFVVIEKQTGYAFVYDPVLLKKARPVDIDFKDASLTEVLNVSLKDQPLSYTITNGIIVISPRALGSAPVVAPSPIPSSPPSDIHGRITNEKGEPLQGVSIVIKGTRRGVSTNENGEFTLKEVDNASAVLQLSYTGYTTQEVSLHNRTEINIKLAETPKQLSEIVVTAFGIEKQKKSIGYSAQVVKGEDLTEARETNVVNSLKGKVAGLFVSPSNTGAGGSTYVNLRGASSFRGNNQPLYVVDGVPIDNQTIGAPDLFNDKGKARDYGDGIGNILPDDIETITVLKGPNAAALYGARGATGVILITTKKGKAGKAGVDFNSNATFETPNVFPVYQKVWGLGYDNGYDYLNKVTVGGQEISQLPNWLADTWGGKYDGRPIVLEQWPDAGILKYSAQPDDNLRKFYKTGATYTNTIGVSGANDKGNYRLSVSDLRNTGIYPTSKLDRQTISLRAGFNATPKLYLEGKINYIRQHGTNRPGNGVEINTVQYSLSRLPAFIPLDLMKNYKTTDGQSNNWTDGRPFNPYWIVNEMIANDSRDRIIGYILAKYKFTDWLTLQARAGTDFYTDIRFSRIGVNTPTGYSNLRKGEVNNNEIHVKEENIDALLTASGKLTQKFTGSFSVGANHLNRREDNTGIEGYNLNIPGLYNIINAGLVYPTNTVLRKQINSVYFTGQLGYNNYLFLDISGRNDWSSTLGINNYSFFYPSVSTSFVFSEALRLNPGIVSYGKLRLSYAQAGNDASPYKTQAGYYLSTATFGGQQMAGIQSDIPLTNLKNELSRSFEIGTELRLFNNRVGIDFTYYNSSTKNQIVGIDISASTGYASKLINAGEIRNRGIELLFTATPFKTRDFSWDLTINFSRNRSKVISLAPGIPNITLLYSGSGQVSIEARPGEAYGNILGFAFKRTPDGQKWLTDAGTFQHNDTVSVLGNIQPDYLAGITNAFSFKGFTLSALIDIRKGGKIFSNSRYMQMYSGTGKFTEQGDNLVADGFIQDADGKFVKNDKVIGRMAYYTAMGWGDISEAFVIPADYVSLREVSLGYNVGRLLKKTVFKTLKLSMVARNLLYIYRDPKFKLMGISPEAAFGPFTVAQGFESPGTPSTRSIGLNLSVSF
jgi:TonB-linked SusC/RagA family outer membrane protein